MEVVSEAIDGRQARVIAETVRPDVMVMDMALEGGDGVSAGQDIGRVAPEIRKLALSMHTSEFFVSRALAAGFLGYAFKNQPADDIVHALRRVAEGKCYVPDVFTHLLSDGEVTPRPT